MKNTLKKKLLNQAGESISEVLIALLISAVALMMLAGMITSTTNIITRSRNAVLEYIVAGNKLVDHSGTSEEGTVSFHIGGSSTAIKLTDTTNTEVSINIYRNDSGISGGKVISWEKGSE